MFTQADLLLIHGFAIGLDTWFHPQKNHLAGFEVFADDIESGNARVFRWTAEQKPSFFASLNPLFYREYYRQERQKAQDIVTLRDLHRVIDESQPRVIVCHSMGCYLLLQYVLRFNLAPSVKKVVFIQADCSVKEMKQSNIASEAAKLINVYRFFDPSLWISTMYHRTLRMGLYAPKLPNLSCIYHPSYVQLNPHTSALSDKKLKNILMSS